MANNQYVNKVEYAGQTVMDITDTTATESDVLPGKSFYKANGAKASGSLGNATQSADGLMSSTDKTKLDGIAEGATANTGTVTGVKINGTTKSPSGGVVDLGTVVTDVSGKANDSAVVHIGGSLETITGQKKFGNSVRIANGSTSPSMYFQGKDLPSNNGIIYLNGSQTSEQKYGQCYFYFRHYSPNADGTRSDYYENFKLPAVDIGRDSTTGNGVYNILTSKSPVTIPQGGTGATTAANARKNIETTVYKELTNPDYNTVLEAGLYGIQGGSPTHYPSGATNKFGTLLVMEYRRSSSNYYTQVLFTHDIPNKIYIRTSDANAATWRDWTEITDRVKVSGDTMTGDLTVQKASGNIIVQAKNSTSGLYSALEVGGSGSNHGVYSNGYVDSNGTFHSSEKWLIYRDASNIVRVNGRAIDNVLKTGDTMTGALTATNFTSAHYNLESIGDKTSAITSSFHISSSSSSSGNTVTFTMPNKSHAFVGIASGFTCLYSLSGTLYNTGLPSGFSASLSGTTVTISRSTTASFSVSGIIIS